MATRARSAMFDPHRIPLAYLTDPRPSSAPSPNRHSRKYAHAIQSLFTGIAPDVLRMRLRQAADFHNTSLVSFLHRNQDGIITALSRLKGLLGLIYPPNDEIPDIDRWSLQLLCIVLRGSKCLTLQERDDVTTLENSFRRHFRMRPQSSTSQIGSKNTKPRGEWIGVCSAIQRLVENVGDPRLIKSVRNFICKIEMEPKMQRVDKDVRQRLLQTLTELIASNPNSKYKVDSRNGKIVKKQIKELQKLKQSYDDIYSRSSSRSCTGESGSGLWRPRLVSAASFKSPYNSPRKSALDNRFYNEAQRLEVPKVKQHLPILKRVDLIRHLKHSSMSPRDHVTLYRLFGEPRPCTAPELNRTRVPLQKRSVKRRPISSVSHHGEPVATRPSATLRELVMAKATLNRSRQKNQREDKKPTQKQNILNKNAKLSQETKKATETCLQSDAKTFKVLGKDRIPDVYSIAKFDRPSSGKWTSNRKQNKKGVINSRAEDVPHRPKSGKMRKLHEMTKLSDRPLNKTKTHADHKTSLWTQKTEAKQHSEKTSGKKAEGKDNRKTVFVNVGIQRTKPNPIKRSRSQSAWTSQGQKRSQDNKNVGAIKRAVSAPSKYAKTSRRSRSTSVYDENKNKQHANSATTNLPGIGRETRSTTKNDLDELEQVNSDIDDNKTEEPQGSAMAMTVKITKRVRSATQRSESATKPEGSVTRRLDHVGSAKQQTDTAKQQAGFSLRNVISAKQRVESATKRTRSANHMTKRMERVTWRDESAVQQKKSASKQRLGSTTKPAGVSTKREGPATPRVVSAKAKGMPDAKNKTKECVHVPSDDAGESPKETVSPLQVLIQAKKNANTVTQVHQRGQDGAVSENNRSNTRDNLKDKLNGKNDLYITLTLSLSDISLSSVAAYEF